LIFLIIIFGKLFSYRIDFIINSDANRKKYIKVICFILILQSGLRNVAVGTDTYAYYLSFEQIKNTNWDAIFQNFIVVYQLGEGKDAGYPLIQKIAQIFTTEYQVFLFIIAILFFTALGNFIYKNTISLSDAIMAFIIYSVLFYSFFSITGHRQTIATAATLFAFELIKKRKLIYFLIVILIAATIHKTCLIFIPFYFLPIIKKERIIFWSIIIFFPLLLYFSTPIASYIIILTGSYEEYQHMEELKPITFTILMLLVAFVSLIKYDKIINLILKTFSVFGMKIHRLIYSLSIILLLFFFIKSNIDIEYKFFWQEMQLNKVYL
jgi:transmembrane protein EpsG